MSCDESSLSELSLQFRIAQPGRNRHSHNICHCGHQISDDPRQTDCHLGKLYTDCRKMLGLASQTQHLKPQVNQHVILTYFHNFLREVTRQTERPDPIPFISVEIDFPLKFLLSFVTLSVIHGLLYRSIFCQSKSTQIRCAHGKNTRSMHSRDLTTGPFIHEYTIRQTQERSMKCQKSEQIV